MTVDPPAPVRSAADRGGAPDPGAALWAEHRSLLFTIAYEITGSAADAEDVVSDCYLRWRSVDPATVDAPRPYLARIATRQALNLVRTRQRRREDYVGPWLPEPLLTVPDVADDAVLAESVSIAMLLVLQTLSPDERAVFLLREVFAFPHAEIAGAMGRSEAAVRQLAHRARSAVQSRRPRFDTDARANAAVLERFWTAAVSGDVQGLMDVLAPDVVLLADGGGRVSAARRPVSGRDDVARFLLGLAGKGVAASWTFVPATVNASAGLLAYLGEVLDSASAVDVEDGRIVRIFYVRNPDKLAGLSGPATLAR
ncbi:RNA polymerase sigma-70 factor [Nakamurella endophytica]|uniref:RNA polymerase sigma24 factor n=1 Tax=Nakamurella endophytica TaxID=1748367 RepID=A0A917WJU3_9ACTN|nr:RNA polymerase sigma-70 factor [Nakamurella endophytica]GGM11194.1 RNA polymerase sigma24 factor [Nakamurella endophytica]